MIVRMSKEVYEEAVEIADSISEELQPILDEEFEQIRREVKNEHGKP